MLLLRSKNMHKRYGVKKKEEDKRYRRTEESVGGKKRRTNVGNEKEMRKTGAGP